eukprot:5549306-Amphidinium_carterae.1
MHVRNRLHLHFTIVLQLSSTGSARSLSHMLTIGEASDRTARWRWICLHATSGIGHSLCKRMQTAIHISH